MKSSNMKKRGFFALGLLFFLAHFTNVSAQTSAFTYQGRLTDGAASANGTYQMQFSLFGSAGGSDQVGSTVTNASVSVVNGTFSVSLDFGASAFPGADRYLEIAVKKAAEAGYTTLTPRQQITSSPYAVRALNASSVEETTGNSVVNAINNAATSITINSDRLPSNLVRLMPAAAQTSTSNTDGSDAMLNFGGNYTFNSNSYQSTFRLSTDGTFYSSSSVSPSWDGGGVPIEGAGTRMIWLPRKGAFRAGYINGTQWDDANIGVYSVAFGENVRALGDNSIAVGKNTTAANIGTIALGEGNLATGANSVALGYGASTSTSAGSPRLGTFVFSDRSVPLCYTFGTSIDSACQFHPTVTNSFNVRAVNGSFFYTNTALTTGFNFTSTTATMTLGNSKLSMKSDGSTDLTSNAGGSGVTLAAGAGSWSSLSDRNSKENFATVNSREILQKVLSLPISTWNYKTQNTSVRHIGAMAQDFYRLFGVGEDDKRIATIDPDGVAFSAIQGLYSEIKERDRQLAEQDKQLQEQNQKLNAVQEQIKQQQATIDALKKLVCANNPAAEVCQ